MKRGYHLIPFPNKRLVLANIKNTIILFVCPHKILHKHCLYFLLELTMILRETGKNAYAKFWVDKQRVLWYFDSGLHGFLVVALKRPWVWGFPGPFLSFSPLKEEEERALETRFDNVRNTKDTLLLKRKRSISAKVYTSGFFQMGVNSWRLSIPISKMHLQISLIEMNVTLWTSLTLSVPVWDLVMRK